MNSLRNLAILTLSLSSVSYAAEYQACTTPLVYETFTNCDDGEGGSSTPCESQREVLGNLVADLSVESNEVASGSVVVQSKDGSNVSSDLVCGLTTANGDVNDMECVSINEVSSSIGKLYLSFNSASAPYYVVVFSEHSNAPIGAFYTDENCSSL